MPQEWLPNLPAGENYINNIMSVSERDGRYYYFCRELPVYFHNVEDKASFRMFTAQLCCTGMAMQVEIIRAFGVSSNSVKRSVKKYREYGAAAFYKPVHGGGPTVITDRIKEASERLFAEGFTAKEISEKLNIKYDTLKKAIQQGRVVEYKKK